MRFLSPIKNVPLLPGGDDDNRYRLELSPVLSTLDDLQTKRPSVTKIIEDSMSDEAATRLRRWRKQMIKEKGVLGFEKLQRDTLDRGTKFHSLIQQYFEKELEPDFNKAPSKEMRLFRSAYHVLQRVDSYITGEILSTHPCLFYHGRIDSLVIIDGHVTLVEWKTSEKQKLTLASTYDAPPQTAAYIGALNRDKDLDIPFVTQAKIVFCYTDGSPATVFDQDQDRLQSDWRIWLDRLETYWVRKLIT